MSGFWDELNKALGYPPVKRLDPLARIQEKIDSANLSLSGVIPSSLDKLAAPPAAPHQVDIASAIAAQQTRSQGFQTWDIVPQKLGNDTFPSLLTLNQLNDLVGYEDDQHILATAANPYKGIAWRTIVLPVLGNFVKIEFLPAKLNFMTETQILSGNTAGSSPLNYSKEDTGFAASDLGGAILYSFTITALINPPLSGDTYTNSGITFTVTESYPVGATTITMSGSGTPTSTGNLVRTSGAGDNPIVYTSVTKSSLHSEFGTTGVYEKEMSRQVLVQFENSSGSLLLAQNGTVFKIPFSTVLIHVKTGCCNIRVTTGYNTSIENESDNRVLNSNPAFGPGHGLWDNPSRHCSSFNIDCTSFPGSVAQTSGVLINSTTSVKIATIFNEKIDVSIIGTNKNGLAVGWLCNTSIACKTVTADKIVRGKVWIQITRASGYQPKIIWSAPFAGQTPVSTYAGILTQVFDFNTPIRFMLKPGDKLEAFAAANEDNFNIQMAVGGYVFGKVLCKEDTTVAPPLIGSIPGFILDQVTTDPFPLDQLEQNIV